MRIWVCVALVAGIGFGNEFRQGRVALWFGAGARIGIEVHVMDCFGFYFVSYLLVHLAVHFVGHIVILLVARLIVHFVACLVFHISVSWIGRCQNILYLDGFFARQNTHDVVWQ